MRVTRGMAGMSQGCFTFPRTVFCCQAWIVREGGERKDGSQDLGPSAK